MKKAMLVAMLSVAAISAAYAQEESFGATSKEDGCVLVNGTDLQICKVPPPPPTCDTISWLPDNLVCSGPISANNPPANCKWAMVPTPVPGNRNAMKLRHRCTPVVH